MKPFIDSNILNYAQQACAKGAVARQLIERGGTISVQAINEFANVSKRKYSKSWPEIETTLADIETLFEEICPIKIEHHRHAVRLARDHAISFYDAVIIASALDAECDVLFSEDLQHGRKFSGLEVVNPFLET